MTLNSVIANRCVISRNSVAFGTDTIWKYLCMYLDQANALFLYFVVRIRRRGKKFTFAISSADEFLVCTSYAVFDFLNLTFTKFDVTQLKGELHVGGLA